MSKSIFEMTDVFPGSAGISLGAFCRLIAPAMTAAFSRS
jgi:hypothetical protein